MWAWNWDDRWLGRFEGPLTVFAKFQIANAIEADEACRLLFNKRASSRTSRKGHARSLVHSNWARASMLADGLAEKIVKRCLGPACGAWGKFIATDQATRICTECLDAGGLPACLQLVGLDRCPVHGIRLLEGCSICGTPTQSYALDAAWGRGSMVCSSCGSPYSEAWTRRCERLDWRVEDKVPGLADFNRWLARLATAKLEWPELSSWRPEAGIPQRSDSSAQWIVNVLREVVPGCPYPECFGGKTVRVSTHRPGWQLATRQTDERIDEKRVLYVDLREQLVDWTSSHTPIGSHVFDDPVQDANGMRTPVNGHHHPYWHGLHIWRSRFEAGHLHDGLHPLDPNFTPQWDSFRWPGFLSLSPDVWLAFAVAAWVTDVETAIDWHRLLLQTDGLACDAADRLISEAYFAQSLHISPWRSLWPPKVSCLFERTSLEDGRFFVVS